jgi:hypothetical protein
MSGRMENACHMPSLIAPMLNAMKILWREYTEDASAGTLSAEAIMNPQRWAADFCAPCLERSLA